MLASVSILCTCTHQGIFLFLLLYTHKLRFFSILKLVSLETHAFPSCACEGYIVFEKGMLSIPYSLPITLRTHDRFGLNPTKKSHQDPHTDWVLFKTSRHYAGKTGRAPNKRIPWEMEANSSTVAHMITKRYQINVWTHLIELTFWIHIRHTVPD